MMRLITSASLVLVFVFPITTQAWPPGSPPQFQITPVNPKLEPDVVKVTYTSDWYVHDAQPYRRLEFTHDGLLVNRDMVLINTDSGDITDPVIAKYEAQVSGQTSELPLAQLHKGNGFNILELGCNLNNIDLHELAFGVLTQDSISKEGIAATVFFYDNSDNQFKRAIQPLYWSSRYSCDGNPDFCIGYYSKTWADLIRDQAAHGSPVFATIDGRQKTIGLLENDGWLKSIVFLYSPETFITHVRSLDSIKDDLIRISGINYHTFFEWVPASAGERPQGAFLSSLTELPRQYACSAIQNGTHFLGTLIEPSGEEGNTESTEPATSPGCHIAIDDRSSRVVSEYHVLKGRLPYQWGDFVSGSVASDARLYTEAQSQKLLCRGMLTSGEMVTGWGERNQDDPMSGFCYLPLSNGEAEKTAHFEALYALPEKPDCSAMFTGTSQPSPVSPTMPPSNTTYTGTLDNTGEGAGTPNSHSKNSASAVSFSMYTALMLFTLKAML